jgi:hypothetical protein
MSFRFLAAAAMVVLAGACASDVVAPQSANVVDGVAVSMVVPGRCLLADCDPVVRPGVLLGVGTIVNTSDHTAFLHACGMGLVALQEQQLVNGTWVNVGPGVLCTVGPSSVPLAPGDSVQFNEFFSSGTRRIVIGVGTTADLADETLASSASFVVVTQ